MCSSQYENIISLLIYLRYKDIVWRKGLSVPALNNAKVRLEILTALNP